MRNQQFMVKKSSYDVRHMHKYLSFIHITFRGPMGSAPAGVLRDGRITPGKKNDEIPIQSFKIYGDVQQLLYF